MNEYHIDINALIIDDEKKACTNLRDILLEYVDPGINILGIAHNTTEAEDQIAKLSPNVVFLDIEMPNENAFHFLDRIAPFNFEVIFVTAYDEYAIKAFKLNAIDYILKPISITEIRNAVVKLKEKLKFKKIIEEQNISYSNISEQVDNKVKPSRIILKGTSNTELVEFKDICLVEAQSSYSRILFLKKKEVKEIIMSSPLSEYEELLPEDQFYRIHRSYLVNCTHIKKIFHDGSNQITIVDNIILPVSRRRYPLLIDFLKSNDYYND